MNKIDIKEFKKIYGRKALKELAESVGSNIDYFDRIAAGVRKPGDRGKKNLVKLLIESRPDLFSKQSLRPDIYS